MRELANRDAGLARIASTHGPPSPWERDEGFHTLIHILLEQQVSLASARAAYDRLEEAADPLTPRSYLGLDDEQLKQIGFSRQKTRYGRELARAILDGSLDLAGLGDLEDGEAREEPKKVPGIGSWAVDSYPQLTLGRPDVQPIGDLAPEVAVQRLNGLSSRPTPADARNLSDSWQPWRSVGARLRWHSYSSKLK